MTHVTVEVFGVVRDLLGGPAERLDLPAEATAREAFLGLTARHPALIGAVFDPDGATPNEHYLVSLGGRRFLKTLDEPLPDDSTLLLISAQAGG